MIKKITRTDSEITVLISSENRKVVDAKLIHGLATITFQENEVTELDGEVLFETFQSKALKQRIDFADFIEDFDAEFDEFTGLVVTHLEQEIIVKVSFTRSGQVEVEIN